MTRLWHALLVLLGRRIAVMPDAARAHEKLRATNRALWSKLNRLEGRQRPDVQEGGAA